MSPFIKRQGQGKSFIDARDHIFTPKAQLAEIYSDIENQKEHDQLFDEIEKYNKVSLNFKILDYYLLNFIGEQGYLSIEELMLLATNGCGKCKAIISWYALIRDAVKADETLDQQGVLVLLDSISKPDLSEFDAPTPPVV